MTAVLRFEKFRCISNCGKGMIIKFVRNVNKIITQKKEMKSNFLNFSSQLIAYQQYIINDTQIKHKNSTFYKFFNCNFAQYSNVFLTIILRIKKKKKMFLR